MSDSEKKINYRKVKRGPYSRKKKSPEQKKEAQRLASQRYRERHREHRNKMCVIYNKKYKEKLRLKKENNTLE